MAEVSADKIINRTLYAKKDIPVLDSFFKKVSIIKAGNVVGVVYSYIQRPGKIYWVIKSANNAAGFFLVEHEAGAYSQNKGSIQLAIKKQQIEDKAEIAKDEQKLENLQKEEKGVIPFYIEKYGPWILGTVVLIAYIKSRK